MTEPDARPTYVLVRPVTEHMLPTDEEVDRLGRVRLIPGTRS
jgi:hypothetical protein